MGFSSMKQAEEVGRELIANLREGLEKMKHRGIILDSEVTIRVKQVNEEYTCTVVQKIISHVPVSKVNIKSNPNDYLIPDHS